MKNKGFSLAEVVITLAIIGVVATLTMSTVFRHRPNQEMLMLKKVYYMAGRVVNELINDEDLYPANAAQQVRTGFAFTAPGSYHGESFGSESDDEFARSKFCGTFAARMNVKGDDENAIQCDGEHSAPGRDGDLPNGTFTTIDDVVWFMPISLFRSNLNLDDNIEGEDGELRPVNQNDINQDNDRQATQSIYVDVNGNDGPNCLAKERFAQTQTDCGPKGPDRFEIHVDRWGKMSPVGEVSQAYLSTPNNSMSFLEVKERWEAQHQNGQGN